MNSISLFFLAAAVSALQGKGSSTGPESLVIIGWLLGRKAITNLDSVLQNMDITLSTKVYLVKAMVFPVVM